VLNMEFERLGDTYVPDIIECTTCETALIFEVAAYTRRCPYCYTILPPAPQISENVLARISYYNSDLYY
jgi:hypothetical protein